MRVLLLVLGFALGVAATLAYATFANPSERPPATPPQRHPDLSVTLGNRFLSEIITRSVRETPGLGGTPELRVSLRDDAIVVDANVTVLGQRASGTATLRPTIVAGQLRVDIVETSLGMLPMPPLQHVVERQINARIASLLADLPVVFTGARVDRTRGLTVTCQVDLAELEVGLR